MRTVVYRFREGTTWGIYLSLRAEASLWDVDPPAGVHATGPFWLDPGPAKLTAYSIGFLVEGMRMLQTQVADRVGDRRVLVTLDEAAFSLTDFQDEAFTAAMMLWLTEEFDLARPEINAHFDRAVGRYVFGWPQI